MCGQTRDETASEKRERRWPDTSELQNIDLVVVGVENETATASAVIQRIFDEGEHVPMKLENLDPPPWFDADKFKRGQYYFYSNFFAMFVTKLSGLLLVLSIPSVLKILIMTGKSSTPAKAFRRYMDTISNMLDWYSGDLRKKDTDIYKVLLTVRGKHCAAAKKAVTNGKGVISQKDLALTQFGFMGLAVMKKKVHGISGSTEDIEGFVHFWRTIGYFMGIEDRFNICSGSVTQVTEICEILVETFFKPLIQNPTEDFLRLSDALLAAMSPVIPLSHKDAFYEHMRRSLNFQPRKLPSLHARIMLSVQLFVHEILLAVWWLAFLWKPFLNVLLRFSLWANNQKYPLVAMMMFAFFFRIGKDQRERSCEKILTDAYAKKLWAKFHHLRDCAHVSTPLRCSLMTQERSAQKLCPSPFRISKILGYPKKRELRHLKRRIHSVLYFDTLKRGRGELKFRYDKNFKNIVTPEEKKKTMKVRTN